MYSNKFTTDSSSSKEKQNVDSGSNKESASADKPLLGLAAIAESIWPSDNPNYDYVSRSKLYQEQNAKVNKYYDSLTEKYINNESGFESIFTPIENVTTSLEEETIIPDYLEVSDSIL